MKTTNFNFIKQKLNKPISPESIFFKIAVNLSKLFFRIGLIKPNRSFDYLVYENKLLILTPLSGSSSIRLANKDKLTKKFDNNLKIYMLWRDDGKRMQSAFNKKILNPASVFKAIRLATYGDFSKKIDKNSFINALETNFNNLIKDKHFFLNQEIINYHSLDKSQINFIDLSTNANTLAATFNITVLENANSSSSKSSYKKPIKFSKNDIKRIKNLNYD
jgi:hypothetical protein